MIKDGLSHTLALKHMSIVAACYYEEANVGELYERVITVMSSFYEYSYEHFLIDNASYDKPVPILKDIARQDKHVNIIVNTRNFGHIRSGNNAMREAKGDAIIHIVADLQDALRR